MYDCDVLIVGGGPVGVTLALELAQQKVSFRIIDQAPERSDKSRAMVIQPRTLELLNRHGHAQSLVDQGRPIKGLNIIVNNKPATGINLDTVETVDSEFPLPLGISQADTERFLDECLATHGFSVERPLAAKSITQDSDSVTTTIENTFTSSQSTIRSRYVVGCDGAHSFVRHAATNLSFPGAPYSQDFLLCDAHITTPTSLPLDRFSLMMADAVCMFFPMTNNIVRFITSAPSSESSPDQLTLPYFQSLLAKYAPPGHGILTNAVWISRFRLHHRGVNAYRDGRLLLAGDAAHIHSPVGGQGMNTGIQDAVNLGWKLAAVLQGRTADPEGLLNSYDAERRRVGEHLLQTTDKAFNVAVSKNWLYIKTRNLVFSAVLPIVMPRVMKGARQQGWYKFLTEFGVTYRKGPVVGAASGWVGRVGKGDRCPDGRVVGEKGEEVTVQGICGGRGYCLLVVVPPGGEKVEGHGEVVGRVKEAMRDGVEGRFIFARPKGEGEVPQGGYVDVEGKVCKMFGFTKPGYVLVRPDLYVAHIGHLEKVDELVGFVKGL